MSWYIAKDTAVSETRKIRLHVSHHFDVDAFLNTSSLIVKSLLHACPDDVAPAMYSDRFIKVCTLTTDFSPVPREYFELKTNASGEQRYYLVYMYVLAIDSATIGFELEVRGRMYSSVTASFDH